MSIAPLCYNNRAKELQPSPHGLERAETTRIIIITLTICSLFLVAIAEGYKFACFLLWKSICNLLSDLTLFLMAQGTDIINRTCGEILLNQRLTEFFCKRPDSKYFQHIESWPRSHLPVRVTEWGCLAMPPRTRLWPLVSWTPQHAVVSRESGRNSVLLKSVVKSEANYVLITIGMCLNFAFLNWLCCIYLKWTIWQVFLPWQQKSVNCFISLAVKIRFVNHNIQRLSLLFTGVQWWALLYNHVLFLHFWFVFTVL